MDIFCHESKGEESCNLWKAEENGRTVIPMESVRSVVLYKHSNFHLPFFFFFIFLFFLRRQVVAEHIKTTFSIFSQKNITSAVNYFLMLREQRTVDSSYWCLCKPRAVSDLAARETSIRIPLCAVDLECVIFTFLSGLKSDQQVMYFPMGLNFPHKDKLAGCFSLS